MEDGLSGIDIEEERADGLMRNRAKRRTNWGSNRSSKVLRDEPVRVSVDLESNA